MPSAKDVTATSEWIKCLVVGTPGTGKSVFASTFPTPGYVFDFSGGIKIYRGLDFDYEQFSTNPLGWTKFSKELIVVKDKVAKGEYVTVVLDDITAMTDTCMEEALRLNPKRSESDGPLWNVHYQLVKNLMEGKLRQIKDLKCNVVMLAHLEVVQDKDGAIVEIKPLMTGKLSINFTGYFDEVYYTSVRKEASGIKFVLQTIPMGLKTARSRMSGKQRLLPDFVPNDYNELIKLVNKIKEGEKKP